MYLNVPGLRNSGPDHWQTIWEAQYPDQFQRVDQENWEQPDRAKWVSALEERINSMSEPVSEIVLIGHSIGCGTIVHWLNEFDGFVKGVMLVAPSDPEREDYPTYITGFAPLPKQKFNVPSIVVASSNDHVVTPERARYFADCWGSDFQLIENAGHFEPRAGIGQWEEGLDILNQFVVSGFNS